MHDSTGQIIQQTASPFAQTDVAKYNTIEVESIHFKSVITLKLERPCEKNTINSVFNTDCVVASVA